MPCCFNSRTPCGVRRKKTSSYYRTTSSFNSRTPCGVRRKAGYLYGDRDEFQFTHPVWGATRWIVPPCPLKSFQFTHPVWGATSQLAQDQFSPAVSIHAPRVGCDCGALSVPCASSSFNSRTPCGVRPSPHIAGHFLYPFQFTHPVWGATATRHHHGATSRVSIHAPRVGCDH